MQTVELKLLPDGSGRIRIHWVMRDPEGPVLIHDRVVETSWGPKLMSGSRWRVACQPQRASIAPQAQGQKILPFPITDDPRAVTCDLCVATEWFQKARAELENTVPSPG